MDLSGISRCGLNDSRSGLIGGPNGDDRRRHIGST